MKIQIIIMAVGFSVIPISVLAKDEKINVTRVVYDAPQDLFDTCSNFYAKLKSPNNEDIRFVSSFIAGVPKNSYCISNHVKFVDSKSPTLLLTHTIKSAKSGKIGYVICIVYPYRENDGFAISETTNKNWLQGNRRFDVWSYNDGKWKVVLGVDPADQSNPSWFEGNETVFSDNIDDASGTLKEKLKIDSQVELDHSLEIRKALDHQNTK